MRSSHDRSIRAADSVSAERGDTVTHSARTAEEHLRLEQLVDYVRGALAPEDHAMAVRHLSSCTRCAHEVGDIVRLTRPVTRRDQWRRYGSVAGLAAALLLLVWTGRGTETDQASPTRDETVTAAAAPVPLEPTTTDAGKVRFRWSPTSKVERYRLVLFDSIGSAMFESESSDTMLVLPDSVRLARGTLYLWKVEAETSFDKWVSSELVRFRPE
jgi:anti-sigma factor RsiW